MLDRSHLNILQALEQYGTLTEASNHLHLTQSALSHTISKLEAELSISLWRREGRHLSLTQAGKYLLEVSYQVLPQLEKAEEILKGYGLGNRGKLRIGMECHPCYEWLLRVIHPYLRKWPYVDIDVTQKYQFCGVDALRQHKIDFLLTCDPVLIDSLIFHSLLNFELKLVVSEKHAFAKMEYIEAKALKGENLLSYPVPKDRLDIFTQFLIPASIEPLSHKRVEATEILIQLISAGRGVCALPDWMVKKYEKKMGIRGVSIGRNKIHKELFIAMRKEDSQVEYMRHFIKMGKKLN